MSVPPKRLAIAKEISILSGDCDFYHVKGNYLDPLMVR
jgi:hypothetical protein